MARGQGLPRSGVVTSRVPPLVRNDPTAMVPSDVGSNGSNGVDGGGSGGRIGPYRLVEQIGEGGMGVVHLAIDRRGRAVAIKVLRGHVAIDEEARQRLGREVQTLGLIDDDRVASVIDADVHGARPYIVTRYVEGPSLDDTVRDDGPLGPEDLFRLADGMARAIRAIHACGVVHRDIKPGNVLLEDGEPVLIDFGIAHLQDDVRHTVGGLVMGTPGYLSPELVEGAAITDATDWWGWAATITYAASGRPPFGRGRMEAVLARVRAGEVDLDGVDPRLAPLLAAALSPDPGRRPHADEVVTALENFAAGHTAVLPQPSGQVWDEPHLHPGDTASLPPRSTRVLPAAAPEAPMPSVHPSMRAPMPPTRPPHSAAPAIGRGSEPRRAADGRPADVGPRDGRPRDARQWDEDVPEHRLDDDGDELLEPSVIAERVRVPMAAVAVSVIGAAGHWPGVTILVLVGWSLLARTIDRSAMALLVRRHRLGRRRTDVPWGVVMSPVHLATAALGTVVGLLLPTLVCVSAMFMGALGLASATGRPMEPAGPVPLMLGALGALGAVWWGPGSASLRRGAGALSGSVALPARARLVVTLALCAAGLVLAVLAFGPDVVPQWWPWPNGPFA